MQLTSLKHGGIESKNSDKIKVPKAWGYCMKKIGQKKAPPSFLHEGKWAGGFGMYVFAARNAKGFSTYRL